MYIVKWNVRVIVDYAKTVNNKHNWIVLLLHSLLSEKFSLTFVVLKKLTVKWRNLNAGWKKLGNLFFLPQLIHKIFND